MKKISYPATFTTALLVAFFASTLPGTLNAEIPAKGIGIYTDEKSQLTLVVGEVEKLSIDWEFAAPAPDAPVAQIFWLPKEFDFSEEPENGKANTSPLAAAQRPQPRQFAALLRDKNATEALLTLRKTLPGSGENQTQTETLRWNLADARKNTEVNANTFQSWLQIRTAHWNALTAPDTPNLLADFWKVSQQDLFGTPSHRATTRRSRRDRDRDSKADTLSTFSVLGGQTAIQETLQTDLLAASSGPDPAPAETTVDIATLHGVDVKPHPYAQMLAALKLPAPAPSLADYVPPDRLFVLLREPKQISTLLTGADDTLSRLAPFLGESFADHALPARYTAKFGLTPEQARQWFSGGNVAEVALFAPDIFFRDNTDITLILRLKPGAATPFKLAASLPGVRLEIPVANGESFHLATRDNLLFLSSRKSEIEKALALADAKGTGSLGQLDEFRVMSAKLPPVTAASQAGAYVYFSDSFIRRLTGPEVKIGQLRRATARTALELTTLFALNHRLDLGADAPDFATLSKRFEAPAKNSFASVLHTDLSLRLGSIAVSKSWGTLANLRPLSAAPVRHVTPQEAAAYATYRDNYTRYWREYFDPIAVRLDIASDGKTSLETFILPLVDNSLYNELRDTFAKSAPEATALPRYREPPVATLAFQFPNAGRAQGITRMLGAPFSAKLGTILPYLKDTVTLAVRDAAPVVQATFPGLNTLEQRGGLSGMRGSELVFVPFVAALVTRPCDIAIPVTDENAVRAALRNISSDASGRWWIQECVFVESEKRLLLTFSFENVIRLEFSVSVENGWLHISNHPWTPVPIIGSSTLAPNHANVTLAPANLREGLPQALAQAGSAWRKSLYSTTAELLPWMEAYGVDADKALQLQRAALGRATPLPAGAVLDRSVSPARLQPYGTWAFTKVPGTRLQDTGLFRDGLGLSLWMRFEDDGLRSRVEIVSEPTEKTGAKSEKHSGK